MRRAFLAFYKQRVLRPVSHVCRLLRLCAGDAGPLYTFSLRERLEGARFLLRGYAGEPEQRVSPCDDERLERVDIDGLTVFVPRQAFKNYELPMIHNEVFAPFHVNPHGYMNEFVLIRAGDYVIDAGACEGFFSLDAVRRGAGKVYAFEPLKALRIGLERTFSAYGGGKVDVVGKGLSDHTGREKFSSVGEIICASHFDDKGDAVVETITLDEFVSQRGCPRIDFIKADVEGAEVKCVAGAIETIKRWRPRLSIAVYHEYENAELIRKLILNNVPDYVVRFGGCYMMDTPYRPFMLYAQCEDRQQSN